MDEVPLVRSNNPPARRTHYVRDYWPAPAWHDHSIGTLCGNAFLSHQAIEWDGNEDEVDCVNCRHRLETRKWH